MDNKNTFLSMPSLTSSLTRIVLRTFLLGVRPREGPYLVRAHRHEFRVGIVLLRGVARESAPGLHASQVNFLTIISISTTGFALQGLRITCFDFAGRVTGSIALGTQEER